MVFLTDSPDKTIKLGKKIGKALCPGDIIALQGTLAAGKTTLTKGIASGLEVEDTVTSPTFTLISEYRGRLPLYHMDVYRLDSVEDFLDLGSEELIYGNGVSVIEWSEKIMEWLPHSAIIIRLSAGENDSRRIEIENWPYGDFLA